MRIPQNKDQKLKAGLHAAQALLIFIAAVLALAVMTKPGGFGGETSFYFALCFLSVPGLIYQVMVPMWTRAWRFANVYAYAFIDVFYAILWFAASVAVAVWNVHGVSEGEKKSNDSTPSSSKPPSKRDSSSSPSCDTKCLVSKVSVWIGLMVFILFAATASLSIRSVFAYRRTGIMPNGNSKTHGQAKYNEQDPNKDAWSANVDELEHDHSPSFPPSRDDRLAYGQDMSDDEQGLLNTRQHQRMESHDNDGMAHPGRPYSLSSATTAPPAYREESAPSALSPVEYNPHQDGGADIRVEYPRGNYHSAGV